jgi:glutamyl-tRNA synthetase
MSVRVRFAPSPEGQVHIGSIHTAIFNWLFARHEGGKFLLRVEDTEQERSTPESVKAVLDALEWMKMDHDEEIVYQSAHVQAHLTSARQLIDMGLAYRSERTASGQGESVIFRMPEEAVVFYDEIRGEIRKEAKDMTDFVIVRSSGVPVSHLAEAVDDIRMGITHVIRGNDHMEDTYKQVAICRALGAEPPVYAHLPMIVNHQGKPYSKRDGAATVDEFKDKGYLPEALFNFLAFLGWSPDDERELLTRDELIQLFDIKRVKPAPARMDMARFEWMNGEYLRTLPGAEFAAGFRDSLRRTGLWNENISDEYLGKVAALMQDRTKTYAEAPYFAGFFFTEEFHYDEMAVKNRIKKDGVKELLAAIKDEFAALDSFSAAETRDALSRVAGARKMSAGLLVHPLRVAVSGLLMGPDLFEMLEVLGKERVLSRIDRTIRLA